MSAVYQRAILRAIEVARSSTPEDKKAHPRVGAVLVKDGEIVADAFRGECGPGDHAEYTLFEKKLVAAIDPRDGVLFTTLEPCTDRKRHVPCSQWIMQKGISKVFIGILDPNPKIYSQGVEYLMNHGIDVDFFSLEQRRLIESDNADFIAQFRSSPELRGEATFDYHANDKIFIIGNGHLTFETRWSSASEDSIHAYNYGKNMRFVRLAKGARSFSDVKDGSVYAPSKDATAREGEILVWENNDGNFAAVQVLDVTYRGRGGDKYDSVKISYFIREDGSARFAD